MGHPWLLAATANSGTPTVIGGPARGKLELCALALLGWGGVSTAGDGGVGLALQGVGDDVGEDLRGSRVALILHADTHLVSIDDGGSGVALYLHAAGDVVSLHGDGCGVTGDLQASFDVVARTRWSAGADDDGSGTALDDQTAGNRGAANLIGRGAPGEALDDEAAVDGAGWTNGEGAAGGDGDAASGGCAVEDEIAAGFGDAARSASTDEDAVLSVAHGQVPLEGSAIGSVASSAGWRNRSGECNGQGAIHKLEGVISGGQSSLRDGDRI